MSKSYHVVRTARDESAFPPKLSNRETQFLERLADRGHLDVGAFRQLERMLFATSERLVAAVLKLGVLSEEHLLAELAAFSGLDVLRVGQLPETAVMVSGLNPVLIRAREVVPIAVECRVLQVAWWDPLDGYVERALRFTTGLAPRFVLATRSQVLDQLERLYPAPFGTDTPAGYYPRRWT